jgi:predicted TIM-barrel fold metal-dependent hydrolase
MVSADCHANEPSTLWHERIDKAYIERLPRIEKKPDGTTVQVSDGFRPVRIGHIVFEGEDQERNRAGRTPEERLRDHARDGIDAEIIFPNKGLSMWATSDPLFADAMCRAWNDWAWDTFGPYKDQLAPLGCIATENIEAAISEIQRVAKLGFRGLTLPCKPMWGPPDHEQSNYNLPEYDPLWAAIQDVDLPITFHIATGRDPRTSRGNGGAVINYAVHALPQAIEPVANLCSSGVLERFPKLCFGTIEAGIGWLPWTLDAMDEAYKKHHMFARPKLKNLPSEYFRAHGFATFGEDPAGLTLAREHRLVDNFMWANDYPHHEGTWPHSAEAIERTMGMLDDTERAKVLGLNAARIFGFEVPKRFEVERNQER